MVSNSEEHWQARQASVTFEDKSRSRVCHAKACGKYNLNWQHNFRQLCQYKLDHGDCLVPARYQPNLGLGHWVMTQRRQYCHLKNGRSSTLTDSRIALMDALGFVWTLRQDAGIIWRERYNMLCQYRNIYGDCLVPQRYKLNPQLGTWVNTQRRQCKMLKEGKSSSMTLQRIHCLNSIDFVWLSSIHHSQASETVEKILEMANKKCKGREETIKKMTGSVVIESNDSTSIVSDRESCHSENTIKNKFFICQQLTTTQNVKRSTYVDVISSMWKNAADSMPSNVKIKIDEDTRHVTNLPPVTSKEIKGETSDVCKLSFWKPFFKQIKPPMIRTISEVLQLDFLFFSYSYTMYMDFAAYS